MNTKETPKAFLQVSILSKSSLVCDVDRTTEATQQPQPPHPSVWRHCSVAGRLFADDHDNGAGLAVLARLPGSRGIAVMLAAARMAISLYYRWRNV